MTGGQVFGWGEPVVSASAFSASGLAYLGGHERFTDDASLGIILMGQRRYDPTLGRFLETDPIPGGSANNSSLMSVRE